MKAAGVQVSTQQLHKIALDMLGPGYAPSIFLDLQQDLKKPSFPMTISGKVRKTELREWTLDYLKNRPSASDVSNQDCGHVATTAELITTICSTITGVAIGDIPRDLSIHKIADSMMLIQFCFSVSKQLHK